MGQARGVVRAELHLPGAVDAMPAWLKDAPFDAARFFEMPPAAENAAPLYLDALAEFGTELAPVFPPDRRESLAAVGPRATRAAAVYEAWSKDPDRADRAAIDAVLAESKDGFRKLDLAQRRPRCVFAIGLTVDSLVPHAQVARSAGRVLVLRAARALDRDDFDPAIADLGAIFRMSRDLRPRGAMICQLVSIALDSFTCSVGVPPLLAHRKLKVEHCDRLLAVLAEHEGRAIDPFAEGVKSDYLMTRSILRSLADGVKTAIDADGRPVETKLGRPGGPRELVDLLRGMGTEADPAKVAALKLTEPRSLARDRKVFDDNARAMLAAPPTYADRSRRAEELGKAHLEGQPASLFKLFSPDYRALALAGSRDLAYLRATRCLVAVRRWQLTHAGVSPTDLAAACRAAGLPGVPVDPFSGSPLKLATIAGEPVVYSVGDDGRDDGGLKDAELGRKPGTAGDYLFRLARPRAAAAR